MCIIQQHQDDGQVLTQAKRPVPVPSLARLLTSSPPRSSTISNIDEHGHQRLDGLGGNNIMRTEHEHRRAVCEAQDKTHDMVRGHVQTRLAPTPSLLLLTECPYRVR